MQPQYTVLVRDNRTLAIIDDITHQYESLTLVPKFNDVGTWALVMRHQEPKVQNFFPDAQGGLHAGIIVQVDNNDGIGLQNVMSGPQNAILSTLNADGTWVVQVSGYSDEYWLAHRISLPYAGFPFPQLVVLFASPQRYYQFGDTSGTVAVDSSTHALNGTYNGGFTLNQPGLIDDPSTCVLLNGTTGYVSVPTTTLPSGNNPFSLMVWGMLTANPAGNATAAWIGTNTSPEGAEIGVNSSGKPFFVVGASGVVTGANAVPLNIPFLLVLTWDNTTARGFCFTPSANTETLAQFGTATPGAAAITYGTASFGALGAGAGNFWPGYLGHGAIFNSDVSSQRGATDATPYPMWVWEVGSSKLAYTPYVTQGFGNNGAFQIWAYVNANMNNPPVRLPAGLNVIIPTGLVSACTPSYSRFDTLLTLIQAIALRSAIEVGFTLQQVGQQLLFQEYLPVDRSATAIFSTDMKNIASYQWLYQAATTNYYYAGGVQNQTGFPTSRVFAEAGDATSISRFGRLEAFLDARQAPDQTALRSMIGGALAASAASRNLNVTLRDSDRLYFMGPPGKGYMLGDIVSVQVEGQVFSDTVRQVQIDLQPGTYPVVTPVIGTAIAAAVLNERDDLIAAVKAGANAVGSLQINY